MIVNIDISVFTESNGAFGSVSGSLSVSIAPHIGDVISFGFNDKEIILNTDCGFSGLLKVVGRVISAKSETENAVMILEDLLLPTMTAAKEVMQYFELAFGLFCDEYDQEG